LQFSIDIVFISAVLLYDRAKVETRLLLHMVS